MPKGGGGKKKFKSKTGNEACSKAMSVHVTGGRTAGEHGMSLADARATLGKCRAGLNASKKAAANPTDQAAANRAGTMDRAIRNASQGEARSAKARELLAGRAKRQGKAAPPPYKPPERSIPEMAGRHKAEKDEARRKEERELMDQWKARQAVA